MGVPGNRPNAWFGTYVAPEAGTPDIRTRTPCCRNSATITKSRYRKRFGSAIDPEHENLPREFPDWFAFPGQSSKPRAAAEKSAMFLLPAASRCEKATSS